MARNDSVTGPGGPGVMMCRRVQGGRAGDADNMVATGTPLLQTVAILANGFRSSLPPPHPPALPPSASSIVPLRIEYCTPLLMMSRDHPESPESPLMTHSNDTQTSSYCTITRLQFPTDFLYYAGSFF